jgi:hypothetical protein
MNAGRTVYHLMGTDKVDPAKMTEGAVPAGDDVRYPA